VDGTVKRISNVLAGFACVVLVGVMMITFVDVVGRYFFNAPITFAVELIQLGVGLLVLFGLALTTLERGHIAVDILETVAG
jgi:TRAP-type C4-dicarboxylate transport system permease small subunit